jgi:hypothetical protein
MIIEPKILLRDGHKTTAASSDGAPTDWHWIQCHHGIGRREKKKPFQTVLVCHIFINTFGYIYIQGPPPALRRIFLTTWLIAKRVVYVYASIFIGTILARRTNNSPISPTCWYYYILSCVSLLGATQFLEREKNKDAIDTIQLPHPVEGIRTFSFWLGLGFWCNGNCNGNCKSKRLGVRCRLFLGRHVKGSAARWYRWRAPEIQCHFLPWRILYIR